MAQIVNYYNISTGKNKGVVVAFGNWPQRILKHRGWNSDRRVYQRVATPSEHEWLSNCMRFQAYRYDTVDQLLEDEASVLQDWPGVLQGLRTALTSPPC